MSIDDYSQLFADAGQQYQIDPNLLRAVAVTESNGNPNAVSDAGAQGLMQLMPATAKSLGVKDATDPAQAIPAAARLLRQNLDRYKNTQSALMAYNGGTDSSNWNNAETQNYPTKVLKNYKGAQVASNQPMDEDDQIAAAAIQRQLAKNSASAQSAQSPAVPTSQPMDEDDAIAAAAIQRQKDKAENVVQTAKANPSLSDQYNSDVNVAAIRIANSLKNSPGGALDNLLDIGGALGSGVANAIGQTVNHYTPDMVKNALTSASGAIQGGAQNVANSIDSTNAGKAFGNVLNSATSTTSDALASAAQEYPNVARRLGDVADIGKGMAAVEGVKTAAEGAGNALTGIGKVIIDPAPIDADAATIIKGAKDQFGIDTPSSLMSSGKNMLQSVASKADTQELGGQVNKAVNDIIGANDNGEGHVVLNQKSYLDAAKNNSAAYNKVFSDIGNVPIDNHIVPILSEIEKIDTPTFNQIGEAIQNKMNPDGTLPASAIKELTKVGENGKASVLQQLASNATDRPSALAAQNIINELEAAIKNKATPEQYARIGNIDTRYKTMKTMEPIARQIGGGAQASIPAIQNALNSSFDKITENPLPPTQLSNYLNTVNPGNKAEGSFSGLKNTGGKSGNLLNQSELAGAIATGSPYLAAAPLIQRGAGAAFSKGASKLINTDWYKERLLRDAP